MVFFVLSPPLGSTEPQTIHVQFYFLLISLTIIIIFLIKPILLINIFFKLELNSSHQIQLIFSKN